MGTLLHFFASRKSYKTLIINLGGLEDVLARELETSPGSDLWITDYMTQGRGPYTTMRGRPFETSSFVNLVIDKNSALCIHYRRRLLRCGRPCRNMQCRVRASDQRLDEPYGVDLHSYDYSRSITIRNENTTSAAAATPGIDSLRRVQTNECTPILNYSYYLLQ